jgi:hypothetical protein
MRRRWLVPDVDAGGVGFLPAASDVLAGAVLDAPYRLPPLRTELLWGLSAAFALVAVGSGLWRRQRATPASSVPV